MLAVQVRDQFVDRQVAELAEEVAHVAVRAVEQLGDDVDLGAVARRQHDGFADVVTHRQAGNGLAERSGTTVTRSSNDSGLLRWLIPTTRIDMTIEP